MEATQDLCPNRYFSILKLFVLDSEKTRLDVFHV